MNLCEARVGAYVFKQGDLSSSFFIIAEGTVQVEINGGPKRLLRKGIGFGELGLIYSAPRSASVKVVQDCRLYVLSRNVFRRTLEDITVKNYDIAKKYVSSLALFNHFTEAQKDSIAYSMVALKYQNKEIIFKEKDDANSFFIIASGKVEISIKDKAPLILGPKDSFGEQAFKEKQIRGGSAVSIGETVCLSVGADAIRNILGSQASNILFYNIEKWAIKRSLVLSKMNNMEIEKLLRGGTYREVEDGEVILRKGECPEKVVIILEGKANDKPVGSLLGEEYIKDKTLPTEDVIKVQKGFVVEFTYN